MNPQSVGPTASTQRKVFTAIWSEELRLALLQNAPQAGYHLSLVGADSRTVTAAVNQGIDACLEACYVPARGDRFGFTPASSVGSIATGSRLEGELSPASLVTLVRRLLESEDANAASLASGICETLGLELVWVHRSADGHRGRRRTSGLAGTSRAVAVPATTLPPPKINARLTPVAPLRRGGTTPSVTARTRTIGSLLSFEP